MATRYLVALGTGNWNSTTNWSATSGGASGASFPVAGDDVVFDVLSLNANITTNVASVCNSFSASPAYSGTLTMTNTLAVSGNTTLSSGMTYSGAAVLSITKGGTLTSNGKTVSGGLTFALATAAQTVTLADDWTVLGTISHSSNAGTINGNNIFFSGGLIGSTLAGGTTTYQVNGTGNWTSLAVFKNNLVINTSGTFTLGAAINYQGTMTYTAGSVATAGNTFTIGGNSTLNTNGIAWNNISIGSNITATLSSPMLINGNLASIAVVATHSKFVSSIPGTKQLLTLSQGATQVGDFMDATDIDSSQGQTIWSYKGTLSNTSNWNLLVPQLKVSSIF